MYKFLFTLMAVFGLLLTVGCGGSGNEADKKASLTGDWTIEKGKLNGRESDMFAGFEMSFTADSRMRSAILEQLQMPKEVAYTLEEGGQYISPKEGGTRFKIVSLDEKRLALSLSVTNDGTDFDIELFFTRKGSAANNSTAPPVNQ